MILSVEERDELLSKMSENQREYLTSQLVRGRRTIFANAMATQKGFHIPSEADPEEIESLLSEWVYTGYIDAGKVSADLRCECGRPLRYQHHVEHKTTGEVKKFGIEHLKEHLSIDAITVAAIKKGFDAVDYELDELLLKYNNGWELDPQLIQGEDLPKDVSEQLKRGLPLLESQIRRLRQRRSAASAPPSPPQIVSAPPTAPEPAADIDLFTWNKPLKSDRPAPIFELPHYLQGPTKQLLESGVQSARIISELLISEHQAPDIRFLTGKPHIFLPVCHYIESIPHVELKEKSHEDRRYIINN
ncbi:hypothetical protein [Cohnella sp. AR92]|uniref:hypothetical protein n=1 Tax=Cohnella sp. AR92 TaxID=648716 RepID=UPI000F8D900C|nr:hypothetical protein [Cohnella sp. AR92]RUS45003.1 hypothetical protein ELR57_22370 [Cohnella sp. AR92]